MLICCLHFTAKICCTLQFLICSDMQYKDRIPKPALSPYMLFSKSKQPKLKQKRPNCPMTKMAVKLSDVKIDHSLRIILVHSVFYCR